MTKRTLQDLAKESLQVQDACNLSGVVHGFGRALTDLRAILETEPGFSTTKLNEHPIAKVWADKVAHLTGTQSSSAGELFDAYREVQDTADPEGRSEKSELERYEEDSKAAGGAPYCYNEITPEPRS